MNAMLSALPEQLLLHGQWQRPVNLRKLLAQRFRHRLVVVVEIQQSEHFKQFESK
jgi:hypothetical protein